MREWPWQAVRAEQARKRKFQRGSTVHAGAQKTTSVEDKENQADQTVQVQRHARSKKHFVRQRTKIVLSQQQNPGSTIKDTNVWCSTNSSNEEKSSGRNAQACRK